MKRSAAAAAAVALLSSVHVDAFAPLAPSAVRGVWGSAGAHASTRGASSSSRGPIVSSLSMAVAPPAAEEMEEAQSSTEGSASRRGFMQTSGAVAATTAAAALGGVAAQPQAAEAASITAWEQVVLPVATTLYDIDFDDKNTNHGYIVGAKGTFLETFDGGKTWGERVFGPLDADDEINFRFQQVSAKGGEVYVVGKPAILLSSKDEGKSWDRVPLSPKLPGDPTSITAFGNGKAEMTTSAGAIYTTSNGGLNWKAQVKETIDATLNRISSSGVQGASYFTGTIIGIRRDSEGSYVAVSSRGNFFLTWSPGGDFWIPHNRGTSRRIQNLGFIKDNLSSGLWLSLNGGQLQVTKPGTDFSIGDPDFSDVKIRTGGLGIIDVAWKNEKEVWAVGGGGSLWYSLDGGKTFSFNRSADKIPGNLYNVRFFGQDKGFAIGSDGVLIRYLPDKMPSASA